MNTLVFCHIDDFYQVLDPRIVQKPHPERSLEECLRKPQLQAMKIEASGVVFIQVSQEDLCG
jgi:hypothetical protein